MREIKFRAWWNGKYYYNGFVIFPDGKTEWPEAGWDLWGRDDKIPIEQFTGLKDKKGKEIYEGDILLCNLMPIAYPFVIKWELEEARFTSFNPKGAFEVIGNIHENPELLEENNG